MNRDYQAAAVQVGTRWFVWGKHQEIVERRDVSAFEQGAPPLVPVVVLCPLDSDGNRLNGRKKAIPIQAWRVAYYGEPSQAFTAG